MKRAVSLAIALSFLPVSRAQAYSVLTHEAIIDAVWDGSIAPLLRARFHATPAELREARAYAYGGCIIQDIGYYPLSSRTFGDLTHYVRSGDFVRALIRDAGNVNEYAFALGALSHYAADNAGHPIAVNPSVPLLYPKLRAKYGTAVTYEDDPTAHIRTEFAFDVTQVARGKYAADAYHNFIGFQVSKPVLERAFRDTYGLELTDVFGNLDLSLGTFRRAVSSTIPMMTKVAWSTHQKEIEKVNPGISQQKFQYTLSRRDYESEWGSSYRRPNLFHRFLGLVVRIMPKVGPFKAASFKPLTPKTEQLFLESFRATVERYRDLLDTIGRERGPLENKNFDTGRPVRAGDYEMADAIYADWLSRLAKRHFEGVSAAVRANILEFYRGVREASVAKDRKEQRKIDRSLDELKAARVASERHELRSSEDDRRHAPHPLH